MVAGKTRWRFECHEREKDGMMGGAECVELGGRGWRCLRTLGVYAVMREHSRLRSRRAVVVWLRAASEGFNYVLGSMLYMVECCA